MQQLIDNDSQMNIFEYILNNIYEDSKKLITEPDNTIFIFKNNFTNFNFIDKKDEESENFSENKIH